MYEELVKRLNAYSAEHDYHSGITAEAADAIEELQKVADAQLDIIKQYQAYLTEQRWTPVTEQLPKEWQPVLGLIQFHDEKEPPAQQVLWYLGNGRWRETWCGDIVEGDVTHWMPLLKPPKEKKEDADS